MAIVKIKCKYIIHKKPKFIPFHIMFLLDFQTAVCIHLIVQSIDLILLFQL